MENTKAKSFSDATVPYIAYESAIASMERQIKRLWILLIAAVIALVGSVLIPRRDIMYETPEKSQTSSVSMINDRSVSPAAVPVRTEMREKHDKKKRSD